MSSITNPKRYTFPQDTYYLTRKAFFGAGSELQVYYGAGNAYLKSSGLGEIWAKGRAVLKLIDGGVNVIGKLQINGVDFSSTPGSSTSVAWADVTGKPSTFAPSAHTHDDRYYTETEFNAWFELTGSAPNQYLRAKFPFACDYEVQAWSDTGWLPPSIWDSLPIATISTLGGIIVGANLTIDVNGVLNASVAGGAGTWGSIGGTLTDQSDLVTALGLKSNTTHNHTGVYSAVGHDHDAAYEPLISKSTGYLRYTGAAWEFKNEAYSITSHTHSYLPLAGGSLSGQLVSTLAAGTSPFAVISNTVNTNLNADLLDGQHGAYFAVAGHTHAVLNMANFSILQESGKLVIKYGTTVIASFSSAGYFKALNEVEAFATP
jgi:hypothetical protein